MAGMTAKEAKERLLNMSEDELKSQGEKTIILALVIVRSAIDLMLIDHLNPMKSSTDGVDAVFHKTFTPLISEFESDANQEAFNRAFDIFSKEEPGTRMSTMENILQAVLSNLRKFGEYVETGKEFANERSEH